MAREGVKRVPKAEFGDDRIVIERRPLREVFAIIGVSAVASSVVLLGAITYADNRAEQRIKETAQVGDCFFENGQILSDQTSNHFVAEVNQKASELLDDKVKKPLEGATGPLTDISRAVSTTSTTEATSTTLQPSSEQIQPPTPEDTIPEPSDSTTTTSAPAQLPVCANVME